MLSTPRVFDHRDQRLVLFAAEPQATPPGVPTRRRIVFAVKGPRFITHMKRLREVRRPLANFLASGVFSCAGWGRSSGSSRRVSASRPGASRAFSGSCPRSGRGAAPGARPRTHLHGRSSLAIDAVRPLRRVRCATGFRDPDFIALLRRHGIALVVSDTQEVAATSRCHCGFYVSETARGQTAVRQRLRRRRWMRGRSGSGVAAGRGPRGGRALHRRERGRARSATCTAISTTPT